MREEQGILVPQRQPKKEPDRKRHLGLVRPRRLSDAELRKAVQRVQLDADPLTRLRSVDALLGHLPFLIEDTVKEARDQQYTWEEIGEVLGVTKQAVWERFDYLEGRPRRVRG